MPALCVLGLSKKLQEKRQLQETKLLPIIEQRLKMMEGASQLTAEVEIVLKEWYIRSTFVADFFIHFCFTLFIFI